METSDQSAVLLARDIEVREKRAGRPYRQDVINNLDAWLGRQHIEQTKASER